MRLPDATEGERRRIASAPAFTVLLVAFVLHFTLGSQVQRANLPTGIAYGQILFFFAIPWMTVVALGLGPRSFLALAWPRARTWPWILLASAAGFFLAGGLNSLNQWLVGPEVARFFDSTSPRSVRTPGLKVRLNSSGESPSMIAVRMAPSLATRRFDR